jgi:tRNA G18 (ribose-2'-O)-methylase SpoU
VANNISFLQREHKADQERWLINVDRNSGNGVARQSDKQRNKHPITVVLDNVRSTFNVGNVLWMAEVAQIESVRLCGMTPHPPHPKVLKTAMGAVEYVSLGNEEVSFATLATVLDLKSKEGAQY